MYSGRSHLPSPPSSDEAAPKAPVPLDRLPGGIGEGGGEGEGGGGGGGGDGSGADGRGGGGGLGSGGEGLGGIMRSACSGFRFDLLPLPLLPLLPLLLLLLLLFADRVRVAANKNAPVVRL